MSRRRFLKAMAVGGAGVGIGAVGLPYTLTGRAMLAQHRTNVGEIRTFHLEDGTELVLNTDSAVDVSFSSQQRRIHLYQGEIQLKTGHETPRRHFIVETAAGEIEALGTEFTVRQHKDHIHLAVLDGAVEVRPAMGGQRQRVDAGQSIHFRQNSVAAPQPSSTAAASWRQGKLVAQGMRVADFVGEIARYRPGFTLYDKAVADFTISGVFTLQDTDRALQSLAASLPVALNYRTDYWVKVVPTVPE
ncbi:MAG: FecR domain-containing protein [Alcanivorax sp.]|uniref:FecR domain-containing protein n=1 Tax=Alcanivorax sp. TaxID=1872427 RepID=UPI003DA6D13B